MKTLAQNVLDQIKQVGEDVFEQTKTAAGDTAGQALEQLGLTSAPGQTGKPPVPAADEEKRKIEELKKRDKIRSLELQIKLKQELDKEIEKWRRIREEQLRQRREQVAREVKEKPPTAPLAEPTPARKKGIFGGIFLRRVKTAQQQAQPETAARRSGG